MSCVGNHVCRICGNCNVIVHSIFTSRIDNMTLRDVLMKCASVQISENDGLSQWMCTLCLQELRRTFKYIQLCEKAINSSATSITDIASSLGSECETNFGAVVKTEIEGYFELTTEMNMPIKMEMCNHEIDKADRLDDFYNRSMENGQYCDDSVFVSSLNLSDVLGTPLPKNRYTFSSTLIDWHKIIVATKQYQCNHCSECFATVSRLLEHRLAYSETIYSKNEQTSKTNVTNVLQQTQVYKYEHCSKRYSYRLKHSLQKNQLEFSRKFRSKRKTALNLNFKWFGCSLCCKSYGHIRNHKRFVNNKALYKCAQNCGQRFVYKYQLSAHRNLEHRHK